MDEPLIVLAGASPALEHAARDANPGAKVLIYAEPELVNELPSLESNRAARARALREEADNLPIDPANESERKRLLAEAILLEDGSTPVVPIEPPALPKQIGPVEILPCPEEQKGKPCSICSDDPNSKPFEVSEKIATVPTDQGVLVQHALCHFAVRCLNLQQLLSNEVHRSEQLAAALQEVQAGQRATHQTLAAVIAKTGRVKLYQRQFERAMLAGFKIDIQTDKSDESTTISLVGASVIHLATDVPR